MTKLRVREPVTKPVMIEAISFFVRDNCLRSGADNRARPLEEQPPEIRAAHDFVAALKASLL